MNLACWAAAGASSLVSIARWLRVSQREHYLPPSVILSARRWLTLRPPNLAVAAAWAVLASTGALLPGGLGTAVGISAAVVGAAWPIGMSVLGTPRLRLTRRATSQALIATATAGSVLLAGPHLIPDELVVAFAPVVAALSVDVAAWVNRPIEKRIARRFQRKADEKLRRTRPRVIAITGSYGKTTVKNHVRDIVGSAMDTLASPASWNNLGGLSRAINEHLTPSTEVFVAEMGTYGPGEIESMVAWLQPEVAVITAIGPVHLDRMKSLDGILKAKREIVQGARAVVLCADSPLLRGLADELRESGSPSEVWLAGSDPGRNDVDVLVAEDSGQGAPTELTVVVRGDVLATVQRDSLHPSNVACAVAAALAMGVDERVVRSALGKLTAASHRSAVGTTEDGITVIDDTFNSNPEGARAALSNLTRAVANGRRIVATPGMVEMGGEQYAANRSFAEEVAASGADLLVIGWTNRQALLAGCPTATALKDREAARQWLHSNLRSGDGVLWENDLPDHYP